MEPEKHEELPRHDEKWFIDRVGKRVFRNKAKCKCEVCTRVGEEGLVIEDEMHAGYLHLVQNELGLRYFDEA